jgi:PQQ-dependent catabolism-associated beta-propeller protein
LFLIAFVLLQCFASCRHARTGPLAYVSNERDGTITVIDTSNDTAVGSINVGARPRGIRMGPDNKSVYVAVSFPFQHAEGQPTGNVNKIVAIEVSSEKVTGSIEAGLDPENFVVNSDGTRFYVANEDAGATSVIDIPANRILSSLVVGEEPEGVGLSPDGHWVYVTSETSSTVSVIDTTSNQLVKTFLVGARPRDVVFAPGGSRAFVSAENGGSISTINTNEHAVLNTMRLPGAGTPTMKPKGIACSADGKRLYLATGRGNSVAVLDASTLQLVTIIPVGQRPWGIALTPDGKKLYAANGLSNDVSVIDTSTNQVIRTIKAGDGPWGIAMKP